MLRQQEAKTKPKLPDCVNESLVSHLGKDEKGSREGFGGAYPPHALERKCPNARRERCRQHVFPSRKRSADPRSGAERRRRTSEQGLQGSMREGVRKAGIPKPASRRSLRRSFAARLPESGYDMRAVRKLAGRKDARTTMIHTHVPNRGGGGVKSPAGVLRLHSYA